MKQTQENLAQYVRSVMELKRLTQRSVADASNGGITEGYVGLITSGKARNLSVDKLKALAAGLDVDVTELFRVAGGLKHPASKGSDNGYLYDFQRLIGLMHHTLSNPDTFEILQHVVSMSAADRALILRSARSLNDATSELQRGTGSV